MYQISIFNFTQSLYLININILDLQITSVKDLNELNLIVVLENINIA